MTQVETKAPEVKKSNGLWASIWRSHFYAGIFAGPVLIWLALTGLVILYAGPLDNVLHKNLNYVPIASTQVPLSQQVAAVEEAAPHSTLSSVKPPARAGETTVVVMSDSSGNMLNYYVNPYTGVITGSNNGDDLVAFANRTHGSILPRQWSVSLPTLNGLLGTGATMQPIELGEILVEVFAGWGLVLAVSGIAMWWPRSRGRRKRWIPKMSGKGRAKWKGLHTTGGIVLAGFLFFSVVSGLPWASFWGTNWHGIATTLTPNQDGSDFWSDAAPNSPLPTLGSVTRFGVTIPWAAQTDHIPNSSGLPVATVSINAIQKAAQAEGMLPNATFVPPINNLKANPPTYGSWVVTNPWPSSLGQQGAIYIDQFTAKTLGKSTAKQWGFLPRLTELGVQTHMGTEFGIWTRLFMTGGCLLVFWNVITAIVMWNKRRRGTLGIPRRPVDPGIKRSMGIAAIILAVFYPLWGCSLVLVLLFDHFVIQKVPRLRRFFGMRDAKEGELDVGELAVADN